MLYPYYPMNKLQHKQESPSEDSNEALSTNDVHRLAQSHKIQKRLLTPEPELNKKRMRGFSMRDLTLPKASQSRKSVTTTFITRQESPWETYKKVYECDLAGTFDVAIRRARPSRLVAIRTIQEGDVDRMLRLIENMQHPNIMSSQECFLHEGSVFILHDDIPVSLDHFVACEAYLNETELAAVLAQVS